MVMFPTNNGSHVVTFYGHAETSMIVNLQVDVPAYRREPPPPLTVSVDAVCPPMRILNVVEDVVPAVI